MNTQYLLAVADAIREVMLQKIVVATKFNFAELRVYTFASAHVRFTATALHSQLPKGGSFVAAKSTL